MTAGPAVIKGLPETARWITIPDTKVQVLRVEGAPHSVSGLIPEKFGRFLSLERRKQWWCRPRFGRGVADLEPYAESGNASQIQLLLWSLPRGEYALLLPLVHGDVRAYLTGCPESGGLTLVTYGALNEPEFTDVLIAARGKDPFALIDAAVDAAATHLKTFRPRRQKTPPAFLDHLGWCTWEAMGPSVSERGVLRSLTSLSRAGIKPRWVLIDDCWGDVNADSALMGFGADRKKFPAGLSGLFKKIRERFGIQDAGVWLTLQGYWTGVAARGPWENLKMLRPRHPVKGAAGKLAHASRFIAPQDIAQFFHRWFRELREDGVGFVKVDGQSNLDNFTRDTVGNGSTMCAYQEAVQGAAAAHFGGQLIACMCHSSDALFSFGATPVIRSSPDHSHKPHNEHFHQPHIVNNAFNSLLIGALGWTDWDMFLSTESAAEFHAIGHAVSGGAVYIGDGPGRHDTALVEKLITSDGQVLRCPDPSRPTRDRLFTDCLTEPKLLKTSNRTPFAGVLALFHCRWQKERENRMSITDSFRPDDVPGVEGRRFAVFLHQTDQLVTLNRSERFSVSLDFMKAEIITLAALHPCGQARVAALGLLDKFNGSAAITSWVILENVAACHLRDGGQVGFYASARPERVLRNGKDCQWDYDFKSGRLVVPSRSGRCVKLEIQFQP